MTQPATSLPFGQLVHDEQVDTWLAEFLWRRKDQRSGQIAQALPLEFATRDGALKCVDRSLSRLQLGGTVRREGNKYNLAPGARSSVGGHRG